MAYLKTSRVRHWGLSQRSSQKLRLNSSITRAEVEWRQGIPAATGLHNGGTGHSRGVRAPAAASAAAGDAAGPLATLPVPSSLHPTEKVPAFQRNHGASSCRRRIQSFFVSQNQSCRLLLETRLFKTSRKSYLSFEDRSLGASQIS